MKTDASKLLEELKFWQTIETAIKDNNTLDKQYTALEKELESFTESELFGFDYYIVKYMNESYNGNLWAVAYVVMGGCSDDGFDYFRYWLISKGKKVYENALKDPDSLSNEFDKIPKGDIPLFEDFPYATRAVYEKKFKKDYYEEEEKYEVGNNKLPKLEFIWQQDDEASVKKICPETFKKWWDNDRF